MSNSPVQKWRNLLSTPIGHFLVSNRPDDTYIAAYPRSGSTWLRTILVNILDSDAASDPDVFNTRIPAVSIRNSRIINKLPSPRLIMTHSCWRPSISRGIYLVRDGRDAFISSYHYYTTRAGEEMDIGEFYDYYRKRFYGETWHEHVNSWLGQGSESLSNKLLIVRFEDMKVEPNKVIEEVCKHLNISTSLEKIENAVTQSSLENARKIEQDRQGVIDNDNASFYRGGQSGQWDSEEYAGVIGEFEKLSSSSLQLAGYM